MNLWYAIDETPGYEPGELRPAVLVWAWGSDFADEILRQQISRNICREYARECVVGVALCHTAHAPLSGDSHIETREALLREAGYRYEDDKSCWTCGLYEMDGLFPVCDECGQCSECGCDCEEVRG